MILALVAVVPAAQPSFASGDGDCGKGGNCDVWDDQIPNPPATDDEHRGAVQYPLCSSIAGAFQVLPGTVPDEDQKDWRKIRCRGAGGGIESWWIDGNPLTMIVSPAAIAQSLLASMQLQPIEIGMAPPTRSYVGIPVWMWADDPGRLTYGPATITAGGVSLTAKVTKVVWTMGDGTSVTCQKGTEWTRAKAGGSSPTCGHTFTKQGRYTVTARSYWVATWTGYGQSGTIPFTLESSRQLQVGEIQVITTRR